jgi:hypothetical protein
LLIEAKAACEHGEWLPWLEAEFDRGVDTAERYMNVARLEDRFRNLRNLRVTRGIVYRLAGYQPSFAGYSYSQLDDDDVVAFIEALETATKGKTGIISETAAREVIDLTRLRREYGDYPPATLHAIGDDDNYYAPEIIQALKAARPETAEEVERVVFECRKEHKPTEEEEEEEEVIPVSWDTEPAPKPVAQETAAPTVDRHDFGPLSKAEHERLNTVISDITVENKRLNGALGGRDNEIARLEGEVKTLGGADLPTMTADKHIEALAALLNKISKEGREARHMRG